MKKGGGRQAEAEKEVEPPFPTTQMRALAEPGWIKQGEALHFAPKAVQDEEFNLKGRNGDAIQKLPEEPRCR